MLQVLMVDWGENRQDGLVARNFIYILQATPRKNITKSREQLGYAIKAFLTDYHTFLNSRHTQFLLFHFVQEDLIWIQQFINVCIYLIYHKYQKAPIRDAATAYLASFVARAQKILGAIALTVIKTLSEKLKDFCKKHERICHGYNFKHHTSFYHLVQAQKWCFDELNLPKQL